MVARLEQVRGSAASRPTTTLLARAHELNDRYLGGLATPGIGALGRATSSPRWGSCTPGDRTIRLSVRLQGMPSWVIDYVLVHELAHLLEPGHDAAVLGVGGPLPAGRAGQGYLLGWSAAADVAAPARRRRRLSDPSLR